MPRRPNWPAVKFDDCLTLEEAMVSLPHPVDFVEQLLTLDEDGQPLRFTSRDLALWAGVSARSGKRLLDWLDDHGHLSLSGRR